MMGTLEKVILSHNRIANLEYFKMICSNGMVAPNFKSLDLNDNYISDLANIQCLKQITSLKELIF